MLQYELESIIVTRTTMRNVRDGILPENVEVATLFQSELKALILAETEYRKACTKQVEAEIDGS